MFKLAACKKGHEQNYPADSATVIQSARWLAQVGADTFDGVALAAQGLAQNG